MLEGFDRASYGKISKNAKCTRCKERAYVHLPSHHANFCEVCFLYFFKRLVRKALVFFRVNPATPILVAVSGGKDSLALWDVLNELGYKTEGIHIDLGIKGFSEASREASERFALSRNLTLRVYSLKEIFGFDLPEIKKLTKRAVCSTCGALKRQFLNRLALQNGFNTIATGHNLDDEASRLLGNILRHKHQYLEKTYPFLPAVEGIMPSRIKPLYRLEAEEIRIYCQIRKIEFFQEKCPFSKGATNHMFLEALTYLERKMPGTKRDFLFGYLKSKSLPLVDRASLKACVKCGAFSYDEICSVCKLKEAISKPSSKETQYEN